MGGSDVKKTQSVLDSCAELAIVAFPAEGGVCSPRDAAYYLAHTEQGESIRAIAEVSGAHPSTVLRAVRRVEESRDDPLVDHLLNGLGTMTGGPARDAGDTSPRQGDAGVSSRAEDSSASAVSAARKGQESGDLDDEVKKYLRRLSEPGSFLMIAPGADKGGIFCKGNEHRKPIAMVAVETAVEFVKHDWIRVSKRGAQSIIYRITEAGRKNLKRVLSQEAASRHQAGFCEAATPFQAQHREEGERIFMNPVNGRQEAIRVNLAESPLGWLTRRKGPDGKPFLTPVEVEAGERLSLDFEMANLGPQVAQDWRRFLTPGDRYSGNPISVDPNDGQIRARDRVSSALTALGMGLADVAFRICCFHEGLEACERRMGWSARSGKVVLKIALQRLAEHYGLASPPESSSRRSAEQGISSGN